MFINIKHFGTKVKLYESLALNFQLKIRSENFEGFFFKGDTCT